MSLLPPSDTVDTIRKRQTLGLLVGGMTHDLNNILAVIDGYTGILQRQFAGDPKTLARLDMIADAAARAAVMMRHVTAYRADKPHADRCDLGTVADAARPLLQMILGSRLDLHLHPPDRAITVTLAADRVTEILLHLAAQARETAHRGGAVHIRMVCHADTAIILCGATAHDDGAYGAVTVPRVVADAAPLAGKTVLFVEDEVTLHPVLEERLTHMGMRVLKAANADGALCLQRDHVGKIDVLLTDILMPDTDGVRLAELMMDARPEISVVYMTGHGDIVRQMQFAANLPDDALIVAKPFRAAALSDAMQKALEKLEDAD